MTAQHRAHWWAFLIPLTAVFIWSLNITVTRYVADYISPLSMSFYRWAVAFIILTPWMLPKIRQAWPEIQPLLVKLAVLGAFGMVLYQGLAYSAAHYTSATNMGLINAFIPIFTLIMAVIVLKLRPHIFAVLGAVLSFLGLIVVITQGNFQHLFLAGQSYIGDALMLIAVFFYACYGIFLQKWPLKLSLFVSLYMQICFALLFHLPFVLYFGLDPINSQNIGSVVYAGVFPSIAAPLLWMLAVRQIGPNKSSVFMNLMPVFTAIIAYFWLSEAWTFYHTLGGMVILFGIFLAQIANKIKNK